MLGNLADNFCVHGIACMFVGQSIVLVGHERLRKSLQQHHFLNGSASKVAFAVTTKVRDVVSVTNCWFRLSICGEVDRQESGPDLRERGHHSKCVIGLTDVPALAEVCLSDSPHSVLIGRRIAHERSYVLGLRA